MNDVIGHALGSEADFNRAGRMQRIDGNVPAFEPDRFNPGKDIPGRGRPCQPG